MGRSRADGDRRDGDDRLVGQSDRGPADRSYLRTAVGRQWPCPGQIAGGASPRQNRWGPASRAREREAKARKDRDGQQEHSGDIADERFAGHGSRIVLEGRELLRCPRLGLDSRTEQRRFLESLAADHDRDAGQGAAVLLVERARAVRELVVPFWLRLVEQQQLGRPGQQPERLA